MTCPCRELRRVASAYFSRREIDPGVYLLGVWEFATNYTAYFFPGIYYIDSNGFQDGSNGNMQMYPGANADRRVRDQAPIALPLRETGFLLLVSNGSV